MEAAQPVKLDRKHPLLNLLLATFAFSAHACPGYRCLTENRQGRCAVFVPTI